MKGVGVLCVLGLLCGGFGEEVEIGDTRVDRSVYERYLEGGSSGRSRFSRSAARSEETRLRIWNQFLSGDGENFIVPYNKDRISDQSVLDNIDQSISYFNGLDLCVKFMDINDLSSENVTHNGRDFVNFRDNLGACYTYIGVRRGNPNIISISPANAECNDVATILRYMVHTLGFFAEQNRPDRDQYIQVVSRNVDSRYSRAFTKLQDWMVETNNIPYDFESITHRHSDAFSRNGRPTIKMADGSRFEFENVVLSDLDKLSINILYNCRGACYDERSYCDFLKEYFFCVNKPSLMKARCPLTCQFCECDDDRGFCDSKTEDDCFVVSDIIMMQQRCPLKCRYCGQGCDDYSVRDCTVLAQRGDCATDRSHMAQVCPRSCNLCIDSNME